MPCGTPTLGHQDFDSQPRTTNQQSVLLGLGKGSGRKVAVREDINLLQQTVIHACFLTTWRPSPGNRPTLLHSQATCLFAPVQLTGVSIKCRLQRVILSLLHPMKAELPDRN